MGQKGNAAGWNPIGSAWALLNAYEYYLYTGDIDYLRDGLVAKSEGNQGGNTNTGNNNSGNNTSENNNSNSVSKAAKTGDTAPFAGIMMLVLVSGAAAAVVLKRRTR